MVVEVLLPPPVSPFIDMVFNYPNASDGFLWVKRGILLMILAIFWVLTTRLTYYQ